MPIRATAPAAALAAALAAAALAPPPASAAVLGHMELTIGGRSIAYRLTDAADAASGWEARPAGTRVSIDWQGPTPADTLEMELTVKDGQAVAARLTLPEAAEGVVVATAPETLTLTLRRARVKGPWLRLAGRLKGTLRPDGGSAALVQGGRPVSGRFATWVPGIVAPAPKPAKKTP